MSALDFEPAADETTELVLPPLLQVVRTPDREESGEHEAFEALLARAERAIEHGEHAEAVALLESWPLHGLPSALVVRSHFAESWARMYLGEIDREIQILERARDIVERPGFTDVDRADALYRLGCCRLKRSQVSTAVSLLTLALALCDRSALPCDRLRAHILEWRSRCYQRQRDWEAARADVERALELAEALDDSHTLAHVYFQASLVAEREGQWMLARFYADEAKTRYERLDDRQSVARLLNNLGGLSFLLGRQEEASAYLADARAAALAAGSEADAAQALSSLAQVHLRTGQPELAEREAREALALLESRVDYLEEVGNTQLVLGRSLLLQGRHDEADSVFRAAERSFEALESTSQRAAAWVARGDLARARDRVIEAAELYRRAAEALQDFHF